MPGWPWARREQSFLFESRFENSGGITRHLAIASKPIRVGELTSAAQRTISPTSFSTGKGDSSRDTRWWVTGRCEMC